MLDRIFPKKIKVPVTLVGESGKRTVSVRFVSEAFVYDHPNIIDVSDLSAPAIINYRPVAHTTEGKSERIYDPFSLLFMGCATPSRFSSVREVAQFWGLSFRQGRYVWRVVRDFRSSASFALHYVLKLTEYVNSETLERERASKELQELVQIEN